MPVDLVYGSNPSTDDILLGAENIAKQSIERQQLNNQLSVSRAQLALESQRLNQQANSQAFQQAMQMAPYSQAANNALMAFAGMDPNSFVPPAAYGNLGQQGAQILNSLAQGAQGAYDSPGGQPGLLPSPYAGQGWASGMSGGDAIGNSDEDDSGEGGGDD